MKYRYNIYKFIITLLAVLLVISNYNVADLHAESTSPKNSTPTIENSLTKIENQEKLYKPTDEVRIVVELKGQPGILHAQESNKKYSELSANTRHRLHQNSLNEQEQVKTLIQSSNISIEYIDNFTAVLNGFSGKVLYKDIEEIEKLDHVKAVYISEEYEQPIEPIKEIKLSEFDQTEATTANEIVNATKVWNDIGYRGEGKVVAVIDRGIDVEHQDMILSDDTVPGLGEADVEKIVNEQGLKGKYYTEKVPYGYNYADENDTIKNVGEGANGHGIHVSGIVGANGDLDNGGIKGVAPEVQILGMKVFSNDQVSSTNSDIYVKAIDDAVKLNVDAINMSFGSAGRILNPDDPAQIAAKRATENGIFVAKSAGNGYYFGEGHDELPYVTNPDIGVISNAQLAEAAAEVASFENTHLDYPGLVLSIDGNDDQIVPFNPASKAPSPDDAIDEEKREVVYVGYGRMPGDSDDDPEANDFEDIDVEGKVALIKRGGGVGFVDKTLNAQQHGAAAVVVFNNQDSGYSSMASDPAVNIPQVFILREPGEEMVHELEQGHLVTIAFRDDRVKTENPRAGQMANSTSWGPMGGLHFKPVVTAAGSQILSTLNDDSYGVKSGTSMAAPQVAGGSTLVMMHLDESLNLSGLELTQMTKNILMNTAKPVENISDINQDYGIEGVPYSPRRQGAGLMDLYAAVTTPIVITEQESGQGGAALKEIGESFTFTLNVVNFSDEDAVYNVSGNVQADLAEGKYNYLESVGVIDQHGETPITFSSHNGKITGDQYELKIPANDSTQLDVTIDLSGAVDEYSRESINDLFVNGRFIDGFIQFIDPKDINPELSVPYVGFYGDWNKPPVLDEFVYNLDDSFYEKAGMVTDQGSAEYPYLGINPVTKEPTDHYAISPTNENGTNNILPALTFLRNAQDVQFNILDKNEEKLENLNTRVRVRKHLDPSSPYTLFDDGIWDGTINGQIVEDGIYYYEIKTKIAYDDADWQVKKIPVIVDTQKPKLEAEFDPETNKVEWVADDRDGSGVASIEVVVNRESASNLLSPEETSFIIEDKIYDINTIEVIAMDWAGNKESVIVYEPSISANYMLLLLEQLAEDDEISNHGVYRSLSVHLTSVAHYEEKGDAEKVVKHMDVFKKLINQRYKNELISTLAYEILKEQSDLLINKWK